MGIGKFTVYNWIKKLDKKIQISDCTEKTYKEEPRMGDTIEMDELFAYTKVKKQSLRSNADDKKRGKSYVLISHVTKVKIGYRK